MPSRKELVAYDRSDESVAIAIGADLVIFQSLPDLVESVRHLNPSIKTFDCSVFTGEYVTGGIDEAYLQHIESLRADNLRIQQPNLDLRVLDGSDGGGRPHINGKESKKSGTSTPINGLNDTVGLHNTYST